MQSTWKKLMAIVMMTTMLVFGGCSLAEGKTTEGEEKSKSAEIENEQNPFEEPEENSAYEIKIVEMDQKEKEEAAEKISAVIEKCSSIYRQADKGEASNVVLDEASVHAMIDKTAEDGLSVTCGSHDYNMPHYETVDHCLQKAKKGEDTETEFYVLNTGGVFRYFYFQYKSGNLFVTSVSAVLNESMKPVIQQMEKTQVYDWEYTEKGWMIWENARSRNQEMDMHIFYRIMPLDQKSREIAQKCIVPVSYLCNNLFLADWNEESLEQIEFNDLFEFLYFMKEGSKIDEEKYAEGIPKEEFESVIRSFFDITVEELERYGRYDAAKGTYPWSAIGPWNKVGQFQPFPEVVKCVENGDGTLSVYVEAVFSEEGVDCSFRHVVTIREDADGNFVYLGNQVDRENAYRIPAYRARRKYTQSEMIQD